MELQTSWPSTAPRWPEFHELLEPLARHRGGHLLSTSCFCASLLSDSTLSLPAPIGRSSLRFSRPSSRRSAGVLGLRQGGSIFSSSLLRLLVESGLSSLVRLSTSSLGLSNPSSSLQLPNHGRLMTSARCFHSSSFSSWHSCRPWRLRRSLLGVFP